MTPLWSDPSFAGTNKLMSETNPEPGSSVPSKPPEAAKVQPKKETVRISLPPKPSSSPTIKLPTMPAGGPAAPSAPPSSIGVAAAPAAVRPPTAAGASAPPATSATVSRPPTNTGVPAARPPGATPPAPARPPAPASARRVSGLDVGLGIAAAVIGLGAVISLVLLLGLK